MRRSFAPQTTIRVLLVFGLACALILPAAAQQSARPAKAPDATAEAISEESLNATRDQLLRVVHLSPKLAAVVVRDPSLLADEAYVNRNNPALAKFLDEHPEIARNPDFYLFGSRGQREFVEHDRAPAISGDFVAFIVFLCILLSLLWLIRVMLENRRWTKIFNQQSEAHHKLLEKFGTSEELLNYMRTDSGKRILELTPPSPAMGGLPRSSPVARILTPLQSGVVFALVGIGFLLLMHSAATNAALDLGRPAPFLVFGMLSLVLGIGLIVSAGLSWAFARHLGLLPLGPHEADPGSRVEGV
jgi:hypothetical protein